MKLNKCPKCGKEHIKFSAQRIPDFGYIGYGMCQDCYFGVRTTEDGTDTLGGTHSSRYEAIKEAKDIWNKVSDLYEHGLPECLRRHLQ